MKKRFRKSGLLVLVVQLIAGGMFSLALAVVGLLVTGVVGGVKWLKSKPQWLKPVWYIVLAFALIAMYFSPSTWAREPVTTCSDLPAPGTVLVRSSELRLGDDGESSLSARDALLAEIDQQKVRLQGQAAEVFGGVRLVNQARKASQDVSASNSQRAADLESAANRLDEALKPLKSDKDIEDRRTTLLEAMTSLRASAVQASDDAIGGLRTDLDRTIKDKSFDALYTSMKSVKSLLHEVARENGGLKISEPTYTAWLDSASNQIVYEESVLVSLTEGEIESLDLREFKLAAEGNAPGTPQITLRGSEIAERRLANSELELVNLKERPGAVTIVNQMFVNPGQVDMCRGVMWFPFQHATFAWPQPFNIEVRGLAHLKFGSSVPFLAPISKNIKVAHVRLPEFALFRSDMSLIKKPAIQLGDHRYDVYELDGAGATVFAGQMRMHSELLPEWWFFRNPWVSEQSGLFFPVGWLPALLYLLVSSLVSEVLFKKKASE